MKQQIDDLTGTKLNHFEYTDKINARSSNIKLFLYNSKTKNLVISFETGISYVYKKIGKNVFEDAQKADSLGRFVNKNIVRKQEILSAKLTELNGKQLKKLGFVGKRDFNKKPYKEAEFLTKLSNLAW